MVMNNCHIQPIKLIQNTIQNALITIRLKVAKYAIASMITTMLIQQLIFMLSLISGHNDFISRK